MSGPGAGLELLRCLVSAEAARAGAGPGPTSVTLDFHRELPAESGQQQHAVVLKGSHAPESFKQTLKNNMTLKILSSPVKQLALAAVAGSYCTEAGMKKSAQLWPLGAGRSRVEPGEGLGCRRHEGQTRAQAGAAVKKQRRGRAVIRRGLMINDDGSHLLI